MQYPTVIVNGVSVRIDDEGRYNLNDLHAAAVFNGEANESQRPSKFLRSSQIKRFIRVLNAKAQKSPLEENQAVKVSRGGNEPGIWAVELFAMQHGLNLSLKSRFMKYFVRQC